MPEIHHAKLPRQFHPSERYSHSLPDFWKQYKGRRLSFIVHAAIRAGLKLYNNIEYDIDTLPKKGPFFAITSHKSNFDTIALAGADPMGTKGTYFLEKIEWFNKPWKKRLMELLGGIPVDREGVNRKAVARSARILQQGGTLAYAPEATRSKDGRLKPFVDSAIDLIIHISEFCPDVPFYAVVEDGTYQVQRKGQKFPRPHKIIVRTGPRIDIKKYIKDGMNDIQKRDAVAKSIRECFVKMLPEDEQPIDPRLTRTMRQALNEEAIEKKPKQSALERVGKVFRRN